MRLVVVGIISRTGADGRLRYLLVRSNRDFGEFTGAWYPPGGHVEAGEGEREALVREIREELGLAITPIAKLAETPGDMPDQQTAWWKAEAAGEITLDESELSAVGWYTKQEMAAMRLWPATKKFFEQHVFMSDRLVVLRHFPSLIEAEAARLQLSQFGIKSVVQAGALPGAGSLVQEAELLVMEAEAARALEMLS
jgi:8-oxo-dGTP pyrophosphatase MutT (NUDIX family)